MLVSACTIGEEETKGVVSLEESVSSTTIIEQVTFEEGVLNFAQCMREEGIDFPDPSFDIDGNPEFDNLDIENEEEFEEAFTNCCLLYTSPSPRDSGKSRMPSSA